MTLPSHYRTLGIEPGATSDDIRNAYRKLAKKYHPDTNKGDERSEEHFKRVAAAYSALSDPNSRNQYDKLHAIRKRRAPAKPRKPKNSSKSDEPVKRTRPYRTTRQSKNNPYHNRYNRPNSPIEGRNVNVKIYLTLEEAFQGGTKQIKFRRDTTCGYCGGIGRTTTQADICQTCNGTGIIDLDHEVGVVFAIGVRNGDEIRMIKAGHMGRSQSAGDLIASVNIKPHKYLRVQGSDLHYQFMIGIDQYIEGGKIRVPTPIGTIEVNIPSRFPDHGSLRLPGRGLPQCEGRPSGDLVINVEHCLPRKLSKKEKNIVNELMKMTGFNPPVDENGLFIKGEE